MSVKVEKTENTNEVKLSFEIEAEKFDEAMKKVYLKTAKYFNVPGFRKGKAPMQMVEKQYGASIFYEDTFNELVPEIYDEAIKTNNVEAVSRPQIDIQQMEKGKNLIFTAIVQVIPEVKLGKYKGIELNKIEYNVSDEDIEHELGHMQEKNSRIVTVEDRPVEPKDITVIDFEGFVDGKAFDGGKAEKHELEIGSNTFIPGFEDQIIGMRIEEEKDINVKFPEEYFSKDLAGKDATFKVKLHEIKKKELPELDDEFAKDVSEFDTLKELKADIKSKQEKQNEEKAKYETQDAVIKELCKDVKVDIPSGMIEMEIDNMIKDIEQRLSYQGLKLEQYLQMMGMDMDALHAQLMPAAKQQAIFEAIIDEIIRVENLMTSDEDVDRQVDLMSQQYQMDKKDILEKIDLEGLRRDLNRIQASQLILNSAKFIME